MILWPPWCQVFTLFKRTWTSQLSGNEENHHQLCLTMFTGTIFIWIQNIHCMTYISILFYSYKQSVDIYYCQVPNRVSRDIRETHQSYRRVLVFHTTPSHSKNISLVIMWKLDLAPGPRRPRSLGFGDVVFQLLVIIVQYHLWRYG